MLREKWLWVGVFFVSHDSSDMISREGHRCEVVLSVSSFTITGFIT